jgi:hypothetical protein
MPNLGNEATVSATDVWLTPPHILEALGPFDLDPCASENRPWNTARQHYTIKDDGLAQSWSGRVWCNPPYGPKMGPFLEKLATHPGGGVALVFARTETRAFFDNVWDKATAILFLKGRLKFHKPDGEVGGTAGSPSVLIAYGEADAEVLKNCKLSGKYIRVN